MTQSFRNTIRQIKLHEEKIRKFVKMGTNSSKLLLALIEDILDLAKMDAGTFALNITSFSIPELLQDIYEIFEYQCMHKNLELLLEINPRLLDKLWQSDQGRIKQILMNLISNALKFTFNGHIKVKADITTIEGNSFAKFSVSDTGIGIPKNEQKKLFKLFGMLDINREMNRNGWGIGLTVSQKYTEALGGKIWLESEFERGTTISFTIPYPSKGIIVEDSIELLGLSERVFEQNGLMKFEQNEAMINSLKDSCLELASRNRMKKL